MNPKEVAGEKAAELVEDGMVVGLGSGSTAHCAIRAIGRRVAGGLSVTGVPTSTDSELLAKEVGIPLAALNEVARIDLTIDGADEIDGDFNMIKGGGGALLREKMVAACTEVEAIVVDPSKVVDVLGRGFALPVEVVQFGWQVTQRWLAELGCSPVLRAKRGVPYETDNGCFILDCKFAEIRTPAELAQAINALPGVVENGLFVGLAHVLIIGREDGPAEVRRQHSAK